MLTRLCSTCRPGGCPQSVLPPALYLGIAEALIAQRGYACSGGHLRTAANTVRADGGLVCLDCDRQAPPDSRRFQRCGAGHPQTPERVVYTQWGEPRCLLCLAAPQQAGARRERLARFVARAVAP